MSNARASRLGATLAAAWLLLVAAVDVSAPEDVVPDPLFALAPLIAAAVMSASATAGFAAVTVVMVVLSGMYNDVWDTPQQWVRLLNVVLVGAAAVVIATVRVRREHRFGQMANIADVAQRAILPILPAATAGVRVQARYQSAVQEAVVGGDLYDVSLVGGHVRFLVGDVRGKGLSAVEQAARVIRAFRQAAAIESTLPDVARHMDDYLRPFLGDEDFATALLVDASVRGRLTFLASGHPPPMLVRPDGTAELVELSAGPPLGLGAANEPVELAWNPGDRVLLYTDGLSEARDAHGEFLPMLELAPALAANEPAAALDVVFERVRQHVPGGDLGDDCALVLLENAADPPRIAAQTQGASGVSLEAPRV